MHKNYELLYHRTLAIVRELEGRLGEQAIQLALLGKASLDIRQEDTQQLADFKTTNKGLIEFVEKVADSKSKFGTEARKLLGR